MNINEFRKLTNAEKVATVNKISGGRLTQKEIAEKLGCTGYAREIPKTFAYWDKAQRLFVILENEEHMEEKENMFTKEELQVLKKLINREMATQQLDSTIDRTEKPERTSIMTYPTVLEKFDKYCKMNGLKKMDAFAVALMQFITKEEK